ncbi:MAG: hypothetical protein IID31_10455 [Planctomycetes bacterium]|nr:hypothetical protein [Planctomycetota bacterium]
MRRTQLSILMVLFAVPAVAQTDGTYLLLSSNTVSPTTTITTIEIWATWTDPRVEWIFGAGDYDLTAGEGVFSNPVNVLHGPGSTTGVITGNVISGAVNGQLNIPLLFIGSQDNPILLATYEWTTTDFTVRTVTLTTSNTSQFIVAEWGPPPLGGRTFQMFPQLFTAGAGVINVVPAPAVWVVLALPLAAATRRRRC